MKKLVSLTLLLALLVGNVDAQVLGGPVVGGGSGGGSTTTTTPGSAPIQSITGGVAKLPHWFKKLSAVLNGQSGIGAVTRLRWLCVGDSTTAGLGASGTNPEKYSYCSQVARMLQEAGINTSTESFVGADIGDRSSYDTRLSVGSGWGGAGVSAGAATLGGALYTSTGTTGNLAFTTSTPVDTFTIWYVRTATGSFTYNIDGGSNTTISTTGANAFLSTTFSAGSLGVHTVNMNWASGTVYIQGVEAYDSTKSQVMVENAGWAGSTTGNWVNATTPWAPAVACGAYATDLVSINLQINDEVAGTAHNTFSSNLQTLATNCQSGGATDILWMTSNHIPPTEGSNISEATQALYAADIIALAATTSNSSAVTGVPLADEFSNLSSYALQNAAPSIVYQPGSYPNDLHLTGQGYGVMARDIASVLMPASIGQTPGTLGIGTPYPLTPLDVRGAASINGIIVNGTKFTTSGCSVSSTTGGATSGLFTLGANSCNVVITMNGATGLTAPSGWHCSAHDRTAPTVLIGGESSSTTTTATIAIPAGAGATDVISFNCNGFQ